MPDAGKVRNSKSKIQTNLNVLFKLGAMFYDMNHMDRVELGLLFSIAI
jgi:ABC-type transporter Mla maintaining outer membrane lipid asymmetry ATPase subunit MlaF